MLPSYFQRQKTDKNKNDVFDAVSNDKKKKNMRIKIIHNIIMHVIISHHNIGLKINTKRIRQYFQGGITIKQREIYYQCICYFNGIFFDVI